MCPPASTIATNNESEKELQFLLTALHREKNLPQLLSSDISSVESLVSASFEDLSVCLPKMVARSLHSISSKTYELYLVLKSRNKLEYYGPLVMPTSSSKSIHSLEDFCSASAEDFEKMGVKIPKMTMRVLQKTAQEFIQLRSLRNFLKSIEKEKFLENLVNAGIRSPQEVRDCDMEALSNATKSKMVARILLRKSTEYCLQNATEMDDGPDYRIEIKPETKNAICSIWKSIKGHSQSFGAKYYELMVKMDQRVAPCFAGVDFTTVGSELDHLLDRFVSAIDNGSQKLFDELSDALVARLTKYKIPCRSLWFGDKAFSLAVIAIAPELEMTQSLDCWEEFYRSIIPPLHPTLVKAADMPSVDEWKAVKRSLLQKINESFAQRGYLYLTSWLNSNDNGKFVEKLEGAIQALAEWKEGKGSWSTFKKTGPHLFFPMNEEMSLEFCILTVEIVGNKYGESMGKKIGNVLKILGMAVYGPDKLSKCFRNIQKDTVWSQWIDIYTHTSSEFGETFYDLFTRDHVIKGKFENTDMMMQRVRFTEQLNSVLIRFSGGNDEEVREMLLELGAKHRVFFNVGLAEMNSFMGPLSSTLKEMLGRTQWREDTADSWTYAMTLVTNYMIVGWTCGVSVLSKCSISGGDFDASVLRELRSSARKEFEGFFTLFAKDTNVGGCPQKVSQRYMDSVSRMIDEPDPSLVIDKVKALGRRHRNHHGVTVEHLASSAKPWMSCAKSSFGGLFTENVALEWARLWELFAVSTSTQYIENENAPSISELVLPYRAVRMVRRPSVIKPTLLEPVVLMLKEKKNCQNDTVLLRFSCLKDVEMEAGQFVKLRLTLPDGTTPSRFYSVASCPNPGRGRAKILEFLIKLVKNGRVSPYLVNGMQIGDSCELLNVAGGFVLPEEVNGMSRLMVSAGVGIVAFMSAIRSVVAHVENGLVTERVSLALIHSERESSFPFLDELLDVAKRFSNHDLLSFDLTLCFTGLEINSRALEILGESSVLSGRVNTELLSKIREKFARPTELPVYACGPRNFQKKVREAFLKEMGHKRTLIHLEFFDL